VATGLTADFYSIRVKLPSAFSTSSDTLSAFRVGPEIVIVNVSTRPHSTSWIRRHLGHFTPLNGTDSLPGSRQPQRRHHQRLGYNEASPGALLLIRTFPATAAMTLPVKQIATRIGVAERAVGFPSIVCRRRKAAQCIPATGD